MKTAKDIYILVLFALFCLALNAQTEEWQWVHSAGGALSDTGLSNAVDDAGSCYVAGSFSDSIAIADSIFHSNGDADIFLAKCDADGNWLWARQAGSPDAELVTGITVDSLANVYITGYFYNTISLGNTTLTSAGDYDIFAAKLDTDGNWLWARRAGGIYFEQTSDIAADRAGNLYLTGNFAQSTAFGDSTLTSNGNFDVFAAKMDTNGNWLWCLGGGGELSDYGTGITVDNAGNPYVIGSFASSAAFGTNGLTSAGNHDVFLIKLNAAGNITWIRQAGGLNDDWSQKIAIGSDLSVYISGTYRGAATFGSYTLTSVNGAISEIFTAKLNSAGVWLWAKQAGGYALITAGGIALDTEDRVHLCGVFFGNARFGSTTITSDGAGDIYLAILDHNGNWLSALGYGGVQTDHALDIAVEGLDIYLTGSFAETAIFDDLSVTSNGSDDFFLGKLTLYTPANDEVLDAPSPFDLIPNHPNPFSSSTSVTLNIRAAESKYTLCVYDVKGRKVASLLNGFLAPGAHNVVWDGHDDRGRSLPSGIYFLKLDNGAFSAKRRMVLVK